MTNVNPPETNGIPSLLPCPFCGGEAAVFTYNNEEYDVKCRNPYCLAKSSRWDTEAEAIEAWNTRAVETCSVVASYSPSDMNEDDEWYFAFSCGHELYWDEPEPPKHCPDCGAKVVGE